MTNASEECAPPVLALVRGLVAEVHPHATPPSVTLDSTFDHLGMGSIEPSELLLRVQDKGVGFDPAGVHSQAGLGLSSMEERVRLIQARLSVMSAPGRGTTVEVRVPLAQSEP